MRLFFFLDFSLSRFFSFFLSRKKIPLFIFLLNLSLFFLFKLLSSSFPEKRIYFFYNKKVFLSLEAFCILFFFSFWFVWSESLYFNFFLSFFFFPFTLSIFQKKKKSFQCRVSLVFFPQGLCASSFSSALFFFNFFPESHTISAIVIIKKIIIIAFVCPEEKKKRKKKRKKERKKSRNAVRMLRLCAKQQKIQKKHSETGDPISTAEKDFFL